MDVGARSGLNFNLIINNDTLSTSSPDVTLSLGGKGWAQQMLVSNVPNFEGAVSEPYAPTKAWMLSDGYGREKVYARLFGSNNEMVDLLDTIAWDAPQKGVTPGALDDDGLFLFASAPKPGSNTGNTPTPTPTPPNGPMPSPTPTPAPTYPAPEPGFYQTSGFMLGKVAVAIVFPQCNGVVDACTESWNTAAMDQVYSQIQSALTWWSARLNGRVTFVYEQRRQIPTGYEPIRRPQSDEGLWIAEVMTAIGQSGASYTDQVYTYNNWLRQNYAADWEMTIFVANSSVSATGTFTDGYFAYSYVQGPFMVMTYDNDGYGIANLAAVTAHEAGHIFGALDQYTGAGVAGLHRFCRVFGRSKPKQPAKRLRVECGQHYARRHGPVHEWQCRPVCLRSNRTARQQCRGIARPHQHDPAGRRQSSPVTHEQSQSSHYRHRTRPTVRARDRRFDDDQQHHPRRISRRRRGVAGCHAGGWQCGVQQSDAGIFVHSHTCARRTHRRSPRDQ